MPQGPQESPGLRRRREEYEFLRQAAEDGSVQARMRLGDAQRALRRQEEYHRRRLSRDVGTRLASGR
jgi:hypothetical protein